MFTCLVKNKDKLLFQNKEGVYISKSRKLHKHTLQPRKIKPCGRYVPYINIHKQHKHCFIIDKELNIFFNNIEFQFCL